MNPTPCPFCGGPSYLAVELARHKVIACRRCRIARTDPAPPVIPYEDEDFHAAFPFPSFKALPSRWRHGLEMQAALLRRVLAPGARVLDVGCGQGFLLEALRRAGIRANGIEPSKSAAAAARDAGHDVATGYFTHASCPGPYDAIVLSQVFEHIQQPTALLADIAASAPSGLLLLVQANWRGLVPLKNQANWHAWAPTHHYWHFSAPGLSRWLRSLGLAPIATEYSSLEHGDYWLARIADFVPRGGDQFHLLSRLPGNGLRVGASFQP